ncbi:hypothetical protein K1719_041559 [Acacia pycnantha]|nr:hypothetical protein K1719_041559 [Acacia pycnantha]
MRAPMYVNTLKITEECEYTYPVTRCARWSCEHFGLFEYKNRPKVRTLNAKLTRRHRGYQFHKDSDLVKEVLYLVLLWEKLHCRLLDKKCVCVFI